MSVVLVLISTSNRPSVFTASVTAGGDIKSQLLLMCFNHVNMRNILLFQITDASQWCQQPASKFHSKVSRALDIIMTKTIVQILLKA